MKTSLLYVAAIAVLAVGCSEEPKSTAPAPSGSIRYGDVEFNKDGVKVDRTEVKNGSVKVDGKEMLQNGAHKGADEAMHDK